jgi:hypothetical protein
MSNVVPLHGAHSAARVSPFAAAQRRRLLRQTGLRASDLTPLGRAQLVNWSRAAAALHMLDMHAAEHGWLTDNGDPKGFTRFYIAMLNAERHALKALQAHLRPTVERDPLGAVLAEYDAGA